MIELTVDDMKRIDKSGVDSLIKSLNEFANKTIDKQAKREALCDIKLLSKLLQEESK